MLNKVCDPFRLNGTFLYQNLPFVTRRLEGKIAVLSQKMCHRVPFEYEVGQIAVLCHHLAINAPLHPSILLLVPT